MYATTNGSAIASLVLGILFLGGVGSVLALVFGYNARREINSSGGAQTGWGMATAGVVLGYVGPAAIVLVVIVMMSAPNPSGL